MIRTDAEPPDEFTAVFPHLTPHKDQASTTLVGDLPTLHDVQVVLNTLDMLGIHVCEVVTLPEAKTAQGKGASTDTPERGQVAPRKPASL